MTPQELVKFLDELIKHRIFMSAMIWGPPGIGKSSIVEQTAIHHQLSFIDVRLSQLAPTDLRGLPAPDHENHLSRWYPPEFLPTKGQGILFLDELNMAPPTMQGMAQQLILDRRVGSYTVPDGWFIWAAGNRKEDKASVYDMPAPLANRFLHLFIDPDFESFKAYAIVHNIHEMILAFISYRPELLHKLNATQSAWPSPRSWMMASMLHSANLTIEPVVGQAASDEFRAYIKIYNNLPNIEAILSGNGAAINFPDDISVRYAVIVALTRRAKTLDERLNAFQWLYQSGNMEWTQVYAVDVLNVYKSKNEKGIFINAVKQRPGLLKFLKNYLNLLAEDLADENV